MIKPKCFLTKECLLFDIKTFHTNAEEAAETYAGYSRAFDKEDKKILLEIARDKKRHINIIRNLSRLIKDCYR